MILHLTENESDKLRKFDSKMYYNCYSHGKFFIPNDLPVQKLEVIWPDKQLKFK